MGMTYINGHITGPDGTCETLRFLVDSGATYSLMPHEVWTKLGIISTDEFECSLVDGTVVRRRVGECEIDVAGKRRHSPVILGEPEDNEALLGALTLENLGLVLNPFSRTLRPMRVRL